MVDYVRYNTIRYYYYYYYYYYYLYYYYYNYNIDVDGSDFVGDNDRVDDKILLKCTLIIPLCIRMGVLIVIS